jgi:hypothetical protein
MTAKRPHPLWYQLATPEELSKIDELYRSMANLRRRRKALSTERSFALAYGLSAARL